MLVEKVDGVRLQTLQHPLRCCDNVIGTTVLAAKPLSGGRIDVVAELSGDHHVSSERSKGFTYQFLVPERAVVLCGVEECHAALDSRTNDWNHLLLVRRLSIGISHAHASKPDGGDLEATLAKFAFLHFLILSFRYGVRSIVQRRYCSSLTCSIQSTALPSSASCSAVWVILVVAVAPCQCFSPGETQTTSPGRISSTGPPSRWTQPQPAVTISV